MSTPQCALRVLNYGARLVRYAESMTMMQVLAEQRKCDAIPDTLMVLQVLKRQVTSSWVSAVGGSQHGLLNTAVQHAPVYTIGPGQCVVYPIVKLRSQGKATRAYVEGLEDALVLTLAEYGIAGRGRVPGATGVWVEDAKIAALGVRVRHGVSTHGVALNVNTDLRAFDAIVPCGITDKRVTSMQQQLQAQCAAGGPLAPQQQACCARYRLQSRALPAQRQGTANASHSDMAEAAAPGRALDVRCECECQYEQVTQTLVAQLARQLGGLQVQQVMVT
ncbi:hypothetical protein QJQ45_027845 [Haematococcus lacustris]|nr:hypothetical protein QJQ45_027845 [Haematococcus lacustris]